MSPWACEYGQIFPIRNNEQISNRVGGGLHQPVSLVANFDIPKKGYTPEVWQFAPERVTGPQKETSFPTINSSGAVLNFRGVKMVCFCFDF